MSKSLSHATPSIFNFENGEKTKHPNAHALYQVASERCYNPAMMHRSLDQIQK